MTVISYVGSGRYSDVFKVAMGHKTVILKLSYYRDSTWNDFQKKMRQGDKEGARQAKNRDSIMVSAAFGIIANELVNRNVSPHFVYTYSFSDCRDVAPRLRSLIQDRIQSSTKVQLKFNNACFLEVFATDMTKWMRAGKDVTESNMRAVIFGILYTLAALQRLYHGFRHNDLSSNNVLIKRLRAPLKASYTIDGTTYYVNTRILGAVSDYDFTHVPNHPTLTNERVVNGKYKVTETHNPTYDTHFFLKSILRVMSLENNLARYPHLKAFLASIPLQVEDRLDAQRVPGLEPATLLKHSYFAPLKKPSLVQDTYSV